MKKIKVKAKAGQVMPIPRQTAINTTARTFTAENVVEVIETDFIRRRIAKGDLVVVTAKKTTKPTTAETKGN